MAQYLTLSTARIGFIFTVDGFETAANSIVVNITRPDGTQVVTSGAGVLMPGSSGTYYYDVAHTIISSYNGRWTAQWVISYGGQTFTQTKYFTVGNKLSIWSLSLIRRKIAASLRDYWQATCTSIGTNRQIIDTSRLYNEDGFFARAWVRSFSGTDGNIGLERQASSFSSNTITLAQPLATFTAVGDRYDIHRRWSFAEYRNAINDALALLFPKIYLPVVDSVSITTTAGVTDYDVSGLQYPIANLGWVEIETMTNRPWAPATAKLDPDRGTIRFSGESIPGGKKIRIFYEARVPQLENEWDVLECEESRTDAILSFLSYQVPVMLYMTEMATTPSAQLAQAKGLIEDFKAQAKDALEGARMRRLPGRLIPGNWGASGYNINDNARPGAYLGELID